MAAVVQKEYPDVDASPVKSFFVSMLTRDITLEEAILDLLDNCVDGIHRLGHLAGDDPYAGFKADIEFTADSFSISDNCGGIPWKLHDYAFRMGPSPNPSARPEGTIGVYGIGLKRAIFKMGRHCLISTQNATDRYEIEITPAWLKNETEWSIPVEAAKKAKKRDGTEIVIGKLHSGIRARFAENAQAFESDLSRMIATHYAFIIEKGFGVTLNGTRIRPRPIKLVAGRSPRAKQPVIQPFIFKSTVEDVNIFLAVGLTRPIPSEEEVVSESEEARYSSLDAGWTIVCNERAVLYADRTELTGWGEAGVPRFHQQFIAIAGVVEFTSKDPSKLPTTTTKRGVDASSSLYLQVKNKMREGMRLFINYTNKWKGMEDQSREHIRHGELLALTQLKQAAQSLPFRATSRSIPAGEQFTPSLPLPKSLDAHVRRISFTRDVDEIRRVGQYLLEDADASPSAVGDRCFDMMLREATR